MIESGRGRRDWYNNLDACAVPSTSRQMKAHDRSPHTYSALSATATGGAHEVIASTLEDTSLLRKFVVMEERLDVLSLDGTIHDSAGCSNSRSTLHGSRMYSGEA